MAKEVQKQPENVRRRPGEPSGKRRADAATVLKETTRQDETTVSVPATTPGCGKLAEKDYRMALFDILGSLMAPPITEVNIGTEPAEPGVDERIYVVVLGSKEVSNESWLTWAGRAEVQTLCLLF